MPCMSKQVAAPVPGMRTRNGKPRIKFLGKATSWHGPAPLGAYLLPCRQCILCRLERSRQWATRLMHESRSHKNACFLTLTYDDNHVPENGSLIKEHLQTFFRDLRARLDYYEKGKIKYFACGEYGDQTKRPHYHVALFGGPFGVHDSEFEGRTEEEPSRSGARQFSHADISAVWKYGLHRFSELSWESAAYMARYVLKKVSGARAEAHYGGLVPEFQTQSNGLGKLFFAEWSEDIYPGDQVVLPGRGAFMPPPYYDRLLEGVDPALFEKVKEARKASKETLNAGEWFAGVAESYREGEVRELVTEQTLIRGGI